MGFLVELPKESYPHDALDRFDAAATGFKLENARALMWMSQLAYETAHENKVGEILEKFKLTRLGFGSNEPHTGLPPHSACFVVAEGHDATFVTFAGSDPGKIVDWVTDFDAMPSARDLHTGFEEAVRTVLPDLLTAMKDRAKPEQPVYFTGHSLGGALAILAAFLITLEPGVQKVVYTFGSPRTGGTKFFGEYTPLLGHSTFRLIDGTDIVPTVPPSLSGGYRHVGRAIQCKTDGIFDTQTPMTPSDSNDPELFESILHSGIADLGAAATFRFIPGLGPNLLSELTKFLPRMVRDHVPTSYFRALSITIKQ